MTTNSYQPERFDVCIDANTIRAHSANESWSVPLSEVAVIGELTTEEFPAETVYCVLVRPDGFWYEVPGGAEGFERLIDILGVVFKRNFDYGVSGGTLASRVFWPDDLAGGELFAFYPIKRTLWNKIAYWWYPDEAGKRLSKPVAEYLARMRGKGAPSAGIC